MADGSSLTGGQTYDKLSPPHAEEASLRSLRDMVAQGVSRAAAHASRKTSGRWSVRSGTGRSRGSLRCSWKDRLSLRNTRCWKATSQALRRWRGRVHLWFSISPNHTPETDTKDLHVAAFLELLGKPFTGCDARALHLGQDKALAKKILCFHGIPTPDFGLGGAWDETHRARPSLSHSS